MDHWLLNRNCLILCFHWFHFFSWQGIWLSIVIVWNQWINGRGERELKQQQQQEWLKWTMDQYSYQWFYQQSKPTIQNHFKSIAWCWVTTTNFSMQSKAKTKCSSFSVIHYSESIHTYLHIWIIWYSNAFLIFVCFHISSFSFIQSIQIILSLI